MELKWTHFEENMFITLKLSICLGFRECLRVWFNYNSENQSSITSSSRTREEHKQERERGGGVAERMFRNNNSSFCKTIIII